MSNHFSADNLKFPGDDRRLDLTDLFVFQAPASPEHHTLLHRHHPGTTVLIMDSNPTSAPPPIPAPVTGPEFYPGAVYRINIDTDGDNHADVAFTFTFSEYENGRQTGTAWYPFINPDGEKNLFNSRQPADDVAHYLEPWSAILQNAGGYTPEQAKTAALQVLPDILHYDHTQPATYPNGRILTNDVYSARFAWLTNGKVPPSGLKPHDDLLAHFPYLGPPNP